jgi:hypothetical protein
MIGPDTDLTEQERAALAALKQDASPPKELESAIVQELSRRGLVHDGRGRRRRLATLSGIAAAAVFGLGVLVGSGAGRQAAPSAASPRYVLFLEGADTHTPQEEAQRVAEYRAWARKEASAGRLLSGEKLEPQVQVMGAEPAQALSGGGAVRGFFVIVAKDDAEALAIAGDCPHLRHGGRVVLRRIART